MSPQAPGTAHLSAEVSIHSVLDVVDALLEGINLLLAATYVRLQGVCFGLHLRLLLRQGLQLHAQGCRQGSPSVISQHDLQSNRAVAPLPSACCHIIVLICTAAAQGGDRQQDSKNNLAVERKPQN